MLALGVAVWIVVVVVAFVEPQPLAATARATIGQMVKRDALGIVSIVNDLENGRHRRLAEREPAQSVRNVAIVAVLL